jgi:hypothetical protein
MPSFPLPFVLSGPILRRVEPAQVTIWIATSQRYTINAVIYKIHADKDSYEKIETVCDSRTVRLGKRLFIHLIQVKPPAGQFPTDTLLGYNLSFISSLDSHDLGSLGLLSRDNPRSIVYGSLKYPSFQIKSEHSNSHILYGSCRKLHGSGDDTLSIGDSILEKEYVSLRNRPDSLFLMGDQIYADDVADPIIRVLSQLSKLLIGEDEPLEKLEPRLLSEPFQTSLNRINGRQYIMENFCQFTSTNAQNHLMELGEFAAMYLLSWSPEIWESVEKTGLIESFNEAETNQHIHFAFPPANKEHDAERSQLEKRYNKQLQALTNFQQALPKVRRLLANIPTYMIFDDHDVTDDWNITSIWRKNVESSPLGRHVIANGITAYWAFQGWGNDPESFSEEFLQIIQARCRNLRSETIQRRYENWLSLIWGFESWHFISPTVPKAVFLDTRTQRDDSKPNPIKFGSITEEEDGCPILLSNHGWEQVSKKLYESNWQPGTPLIIISATPVYGMGLIESFLHDYVYPFRVLGVDVQTSFDFEAWKYNGKGFTEFLRNAANWSPSSCIILSGDVHYAAAVESKVSFHDGKVLNIHQFTSSPFKNMSFSGLWGLMMKGVISLNVRQRKNKEIHRYCSPEYEIIKTDDQHKEFIWKDQLRYKSVKGDSIIETNNNLGSLTISGEKITNNLFTF